jgi:hypothetical protein
VNLTKFSKDLMKLSASRWTVPRDYFEPLYDYLVHGFEPGSFWSAVLANDFMWAMQHSHPSNSIEALKHTVGWIQDSFPVESYGNRYIVEDWIHRSSHDRRLILESSRLIYTEQEEIIKGLRGDRSTEPQLY